MPVAKKVGKKTSKNKLTIDKRERERSRGREAAEEVDSEWER